MFHYDEGLIWCLHGSNDAAYDITHVKDFLIKDFLMERQINYFLASGDFCHLLINFANSGADPEFLERGFICMKVYEGVGDLLCGFYLIFLKSLRPNYFIFIGYLKTGDREWGSSKTS